MHYTILIYVPADAPAPDAEADMNPAWFDYTREMHEAGIHRGGEALLPTEAATTVRVRDGQTITSDGPFAETKEILAGFYLIEVDDLDTALDWARMCPASEYGSVEVRPVVQFAEKPTAG